MFWVLAFLAGDFEERLQSLEDLFDQRMAIEVFPCFSPCALNDLACATSRFKCPKTTNSAPNPEIQLL